MPSTYSSLLRLELMATGEKSATWGDITNTNLGTLLEKSIAGLASVNVTAGNVTLTALNGTDDESRCAIISVTGTPGVSRNVVAPSSSKVYAVLNGSNAAIVFKGAATSGVTLAAGEEAWLAWNGSDFVLIGVPQSSPSFAGQIFGPAGTVSLPGYTFTGDGNNGWWAPAADTQAWSTAGSERLRVNNTGQFTQNGTAVGIAANANTALTLAMGSGAYLSAKGSGGQEMIAGVDTSGVVVGSYSNHQLVLRSNNIDRVTVNTSGNFGIGISPTFRLDVAESSAGNAVARMLNLGTGASAHASVRVESAAAGGDAYTYYIRTGTYDWYTGLDATDNYYKIGTGSAVGTQAALVIAPSSIGVGVVPTSHIDVSVAGTPIRQRLRAGAGFASILSICGNNTTAESTSLDIQMDSAGAADIVQRNNARLSLYTNGTERLRLNADGSFYGTALHNVGSPTGTTTQYIASGTYTPTQPGASGNVASTTPNKAQWMRVGNVVTVSGSVAVDPTSANTQTFFQLSLPIASGLTSTADLAGSGSFIDVSDVMAAVKIQADTAGDAAQFVTRSTADTASNTWFYTYTYEVK